jgi:prolyl 4-hydroxylase
MNEYLSKLLYTRESVLPKYVCDHIINMFDDNKELHKPGEAGGNINYKYRKVTGFLLPKKNDDWFHMESLLYFIVNRHFDQYLKTVSIGHCTGETFILPEFNIMKYEKKSDYFKSHNDFLIDIDNRNYRYASFIIYLNTVTEGGSTIFWDTHKEKPIAGKIVFFPSGWTFQHQGEMPISNDKYIIVGWICNSFSNM